MSKQRNINKCVMLDSASIYLCQEKECMRSHARSSNSLNKIINTDIEFQKKFCVIIVELHGLFAIYVTYDSVERHIIEQNNILPTIINYQQQD